MTGSIETLGMATLRRERKLMRELILVLVVKLTIVGLAAVFIFGPNQRPPIDAAKVTAHLIGAPAAPAVTAASNRKIP